MSADKEMLLKQLKGWSMALSDAIDKYSPQLLSGDPSHDPKDLELPRNKVRRLVREIGEIQDTIEQEVFR